MKTKNQFAKIAVACVIASMLVLAASSQSLAQPGTPDSVSGSFVTLVARKGTAPVRVPAPPLRTRNGTVPNAANVVPFKVNYNPASCNGNVAPWPAAAHDAFSYAAAIWATLLNGTRTISIDACWRTNMDSNVLGSARPATMKKDFNNAPQTNTYYAVALANQLSEQDLNWETAEIFANFNSNFTWYLGTDGNTPMNQYDFVTVVLHEIGHGLGFTDSFERDDTGIGSHYEPPYSYDRFIVKRNLDGTVTRLLSYTNPSSDLGGQLVSNKVYFDGARAKAANGGNLVKLYAPTTWDPGSSIAHLDDTTYDGTSNALMTHDTADGESAHYPGRIGLGVLADVGWSLPTADLVYVDIRSTGPGEGSIDHPFNNVTGGTDVVDNGGQVWIFPGTYNEPLTLTRPMTLYLWGLDGSVIVDPP